MTRRIFLFCLLFSSTAWAAEEVFVALPVDARFLAARVADALGMDQQGRSELVQDACNRVVLTELEVRPEFERIRTALAIQATAGMEAFGHCVGPEMSGIMRLDLVPAVEPGGQVISFEPHALELRRPDDTPVRLSTPLRLVTDNLVLPRLGGVRIDLSQPLAALDDLIGDVLDSPPEALAERSRIAALDPVPDALVATLGFTVSPPRLELAAAEPPLEAAELAAWHRLEDELDGFLTAVTVHLAHLADTPDLRLDLLSVLLDARYEITRALGDESRDAEDPVRALFVRSWDRLRPHLAELESLLAEDDLMLAGFIAGGDLIRALDMLGPEYGVEITRDGLRRLARLLLAEQAPPAFTPLPLEIDPELRVLFGFAPWPERHLPYPLAARHRGGAARWLDFLLPSAHARIRDQTPGQALQNRVPRLAELDDYLALVAELLEQEAQARLSNGSKIPADYHEKLDPLVRATAWKESCWRQFTGSGDAPRVLTSPVGAVGMMQINARVWRGIYDLERLRDDVQYNVAAGIEILEHYLVDYAIRRGEHEQPGGADNLIRATYAAYNGGPSHLSRYRNADTPTRLRAIDREFWRHFRSIRREGWPEVSSCYPV